SFCFSCREHSIDVIRGALVAATGECLQALWLDRILETHSLQQGGGLVHSEMWNLPIARNFIDACSQSQTTETALRVLLYDLNTRYRIIRPHSSPTPKRVREMEQESEPTA